MFVVLCHYHERCPLLKVYDFTFIRNGTYRILAQFAKHHEEGSEIPHRQYSIYIQVLQWLTCPKGHGACATERQSGVTDSTVHVLYSLIVHLVYIGIQTYSTAVSMLLAPKNWLEREKKKKKKKKERKISLFIKPELLSNSNGDKHFSVSGSLQQSTSCRELFILFIQSVCT